MVLKEIQKCYMKQVHATKCKVEYEVGKRVLLNVKNFTTHDGLTQECLCPSL